MQIGQYSFINTLKGKKWIIICCSSQQIVLHVSLYFESSKYVLFALHSIREYTPNSKVDLLYMNRMETIIIFSNKNWKYCSFLILKKSDVYNMY